MAHDVHLAHSREIIFHCDSVEVLPLKGWGEITRYVFSCYVY